MLNELALFAGAGGGILGGQLLRWRTVCAVERDAYAAAVLAQRQNDGLLDLFPIWSDITTFDGKPWRGIVDVVSGGFPCQDISVAGKGAGIEGERSGLWGEMERIISEVRPRFVFVENSPALTLRGLGRVLGDLAALGYDAEWGVLGASDVGAPHKRERIWIVGHSRSDGRSTRGNDHTEHDRTVASANDQHSGVLANTEGERTWDVSKNIWPSGGKINTLNNSGCTCGRIDRQKNWQDVSNSTRLYDGCGDTGTGEGQIQQSGVCACKGDVPDTDIQYVYDSGFRAGEIPQQQASGVQKLLSNTNSKRLEKQHSSTIASKSRQPAGCDTPERRETGWPTEPDVGRVANGVEFRVDRLKALGNGQVPKCAAEAWCRLMERIKNND
jgi:DNA (cytosine-5)-methyltransferase 1